MKTDNVNSYENHFWLFPIDNGDEKEIDQARATRYMKNIVERKYIWKRKDSLAICDYYDKSKKSCLFLFMLKI